MRVCAYLLALLLALVAAESCAAPPAPSSRVRLLGVEIVYPAYLKAGATYSMSNLRFAGVALGDRSGVWLVDLKASGPLGGDNEPLHCTPDSAMTITGGTWLLRTWAGEISGEVTGGLVAFRPDLPIFGRCKGPVPVTLTVTVSRATGPYASVTAARISHASVDHRFVPATITADVLLDE